MSTREASEEAVWEGRVFDLATGMAWRRATTRARDRVDPDAWAEAQGRTCFRTQDVVGVPGESIWFTAHGPLRRAAFGGRT